MIKLFLLLFISFSVIKAQSPDDLIEKSINATAGKEINTIIVEANMKAIGKETKLKIFNKKPDLVRTDIEGDGVKIIKSYDGMTLWVINTIGGMTEPQILSYDETQLSKRDNLIFINPIEVIKLSEATFTLIPNEVLNGNYYLKLKAVDRYTRVYEIYIDPQTYLPYMIKSKPNTYTQEFDSEKYFLEYKKYGTLNIPTKILIKFANLGEMSATFDNIIVNTKIEDAFFKIPKK